MRIVFENFEAEIPILASHLLPVNVAALAQNCKLENGNITAFRATAKDEATALTAVKSLFQYAENGNLNWVTSANVLHFVKSPVSGDTYERVYFTGETEPRFFANDNVSSPFDESTDFYKLGIPAPTAAPTVGSAGGGSNYRSYVYSFVNSYGDEGPPSPLDSISNYASGYATVEDIEAAPASRAINRIFLYRTNASGQGTAEYQYVLQATWFNTSTQYEVGDYVIYATDLYKCTIQHTAGAWNGSNFTAGENVSNADLLSIFPKTNYDPPPSGLTGLISLPNGGMAGFVDNELYLSEPGFPHAWPTDYKIGVDSDIVGIGNDQLRITIVTESNPYIVYGSHPSATTRERSSTKYPGLGTRNVVSGGGGVFFWTRQGLIFSGLSGYVNVTEKLLSPDQVDDYSPVTLAGYFFENKYFAFDSVSEIGFFIDMTSGRLVSLSTYAHAAHVTDDGYLYIVEDDIAIVDENNPPAAMPLCVSKWEGDTNNYLVSLWRSKEVILQKNINFSVAKVIIDDSFYGEVSELVDLVTLNAATWAAGLTGALGLTAIASTHELAGDEMISLGQLSVSESISFRLYVESELFKSKTVEDAESIFRLPGQKTYNRLYVEISGFAPVKRVILATSVDEL